VFHCGAPFSLWHNKFFVFHIAHNVGSNLARSIVARVGANDQPDLSHYCVQSFFDSASVDAATTLGNSENMWNHALHREACSEVVGASDAHHLCQILVGFIAVGWSVEPHTFEHLVEMSDGFAR